MIVDFQCGDSITIPEGCKAIVKDGSVVFEKEDKEEVQEFKDGDVLIDDGEFSEYPCKIIMIYKGTKSKDGCYECYIHRDMAGSLTINGECCNAPSAKVRYATEEEKAELFDKMKEQGLQWNAEEKRVEKIRWRAKEGKDYIVLVGTSFEMDFYTEHFDEIDIKLYNSGNYFRTQYQAIEAAKRVKETLRKYHEEIGE